MLLKVFHELAVSLSVSCILVLHSPYLRLWYPIRACMRKTVENQLSGCLHLTTLFPSPYVGFISLSYRYGSVTQTDFIPPWIQGVWCQKVARTAHISSSSKQTPFGSTLPALLPQTTAPVSCRECLPSIHRIMFFTCFNIPYNVNDKLKRNFAKLPVKIVLPLDPTHVLHFHRKEWATCCTESFGQW